MKKRGRTTAKKRRRQIKIKMAMLSVLFAGLVVMFVFVWKHFETEEKPVQSAEKKGTLVCIDAGHGGKDNGAHQGERLEKDDNLTLALAVRDACEAKGMSVVLTREDDTFLTLQERCDVANTAGADLFVSLHRNSAEKGDPKGVEIWTASKGSGKQMAQAILDRLAAVGISENRGVQQGTSDSGDRADYYVNKHTKMPACLVEMGFITNDADNELLDAHLQEYAEAIADGIAEAAEEMLVQEE